MYNWWECSDACFHCRWDEISKHRNWILLFGFIIVGIVVLQRRLGKNIEHPTIELRSSKKNNLTINNWLRRQNFSIKTSSPSLSQYVCSFFPFSFFSSSYLTLTYHTLISDRGHWKEFYWRREFCIVYLCVWMKNSFEEEKWQSCARVEHRRQRKQNMKYLILYGSFVILAFYALSGREFETFFTKKKQRIILVWI